MTLEILGYISSLLIGVSLGLIGGGGSILSVPVLTYLFAVNEKMATAYSLFIVGATALIGGWQQSRKGLVDWRTAIIFGIPAIIGVTLVRHYVIPNMPDDLFTIGNFTVTRRFFMLGLFALLMFPAAYSMLHEKKSKEEEKKEVKYNYPLIFIEGLVVGGITGLVGAGGGFLIIPALVVLANLDMKAAVATSLVIIAMKSLLGFFFGDAFSGEPIDWTFLMNITGLAIIGIFIGTYLAKFVDGKSLKKGFGYFIILMAFFIFYMEIFVKS